MQQQEGSVVFYEGSLQDVFFIGRENKKSWTFNLINFYVVVPGLAVVMLRVQKPEAGEPPFNIFPQHIIEFLAGPTSKYRVPYPESHAKLYFRNSEVDLDP